MLYLLVKNIVRNPLWYFSHFVLLLILLCCSDLLVGSRFLLWDGPGSCSSDTFLRRHCEAQQAFKIMAVFSMRSVKNLVQDTLYVRQRNNAANDMYSHTFFGILVGFFFLIIKLSFLLRDSHEKGSVALV